MRLDYQEEAANKLAACVGKYITIYHKYKLNTKDRTYSEDMCVAKVISVTKAQFLSVPKIRIQFCDGKTVDLMYNSLYRGHLMLHWDYMRVGRRYNDMFVAFGEEGWEYTYPDYKDKEAVVDYFLTTGDMFVKFFETDTEVKETIMFYQDKLKEAEENRMAKRANPVATVQAKVETIPTKDLDKLFLARA